MGKQKTFTSMRKLDSLPVGSKVSFGAKPYDCTYWEKDEFGWWESGASWFQPFTAESMLAYQAHRGRPTAFAVEREGGELSERQQWISAPLRKTKAAA